MISYNFLISKEGEAIKFVYLRTTCRSLTFPLLHVFTTGVRVQLLCLLDEPFGVRVNNLKLFAWRSHLMAFSGLTLISKVSLNRPQESPNSRKIDLAPIAFFFLQ